MSIRDAFAWAGSTRPEARTRNHDAALHGGLFRRRTRRYDAQGARVARVLPRNGAHLLGGRRRWENLMENRAFWNILEKTRRAYNPKPLFRYGGAHYLKYGDYG